MNVHKTFRRRPGCLLNVLRTVNLRPVSMGLVPTETHLLPYPVAVRSTCKHQIWFGIDRSKTESKDRMTIG